MNTQNPKRNWFKNSLSIKMLTVGVLTLILLIPLNLVEDLIHERKYRQQDVVNEINQKWGSEVTLYGPIFKIPYSHYVTQRVFSEETKTYFEQEEESIRYAFVFPDQLDVQAEVESKPLKRGNYESVVFSSEFKISGQFTPVDLSDQDIEQKNIHWDKVKVLFKTSNLKGIKTAVEVNLDGKPRPLSATFNHQNSDGLKLLESKPFEIKPDDTLSFDFNLDCNGSRFVKLIPVGKETNMQMSSTWKDPSFDGNFLPNVETKQISEDGFSADWTVLHINRAFSQQHLGSVPNLQNYAFGARFVVPANEYQQSERSVKYGFLVIALTFGIFLLIQLINKIYIHPFQYLMIGLALTLFYTLLVSISEHSSFSLAYIISCFATILMISLYSKSILKSAKFSLFIGSALSILYSFLFVIIQLKFYSLLVGSVGLFVILALIMYVSRKIDWEQRA
ncbi:MAG: cell envelope integrity protein CreD [Flavobacteriales bacterium]